MRSMLSRNWGWITVRGVIAVLFGLFTLFNPAITLAVLILWFGIFVLMDGVFIIVSAIVNRRGESHWAALIFGGILSIAIGLFTIFMPGITTVVLLALIATWAILIGLIEIIAAIRLRKEISGEWMFILAGILAIAFGVVLIMNPGVGALAVVIWIGAYAVISGIVLIGLSLRLRSWDRKHAPSTR